MRANGVLVAAGFGISLLLGAAQELSPSIAHGRQIYLSGSSADKTRITARLGDDPEPIPASTFPCANCHTYNGRGKTEGGIYPSDITWSALTKPYDVTSASGRKRGPYSEHLLRRAITMGIDSSGNALSPAMPRFQMSQGDLADLVAYIKTLGNDPRLGLTETSIRIGAILPPIRLAEMHDAVKAALKAYFEELNRQGGIFHRQIELITVDFPEDGDQSASGISDYLTAQRVFAVTSSFVAGREEELTPIFARQETPLIATFTLDAPNPASQNPYIFYLNDGISGEAKALAAFAEKLPDAETARTAIVCSDSKLSRELADTVEQARKGSGLPAPARITLLVGVNVSDAMKLRTSISAYDVVFVMASTPETRDILHNTGAAGSTTTFLVPGFFADSGMTNAAAGVASRLFVAVSPVHQGITEDGKEEYRRLAESYRLPAVMIDEQWMALAGAKLFVEGLKRAGRNVDRQSFVESLEGLSNFDTGFAPPISYSPNRRAGSQHAQMMKLDGANGRLVPADRE
jgi:ABC-type branched-subunit amino acid transport system substrate-binding protein